jgi:putative ABC transport system permease protein
MQMLFGDRTKYMTLVLSLAFATMLMNQQGAIFLGLLRQATGPLQNVGQADLWIVDPSTEWIAEYRPLSDTKLQRVRSVEGVAWAEPFFSNYAITELNNGTFKRVQIIGIARSTLAGRPPEMIEGRIEDLWTPDAIIVEQKSRVKLGNVNIGDVIKINDKRAVVVGFCKARQGFESNAIIYTTYDNATQFTPVGRKAISYILVRAKEGVGLDVLKQRINALGDVAAWTTDEFRVNTMRFITIATGIGFNFGITIALGFVVGLLLSASVFYQFTLENLRQFATLKALGASAWLLARMVLLQALVVGFIGYGIGVGMAGAFTLVTKYSESELAAILPWELLVISLVAMLMTVMLGSVLSLRRVVTVSPGAVFSSAT